MRILEKDPSVRAGGDPSNDLLRAMKWDQKRHIAVSGFLAEDRMFGHNHEHRESKIVKEIRFMIFIRESLSLFG